MTSFGSCSFRYIFALWRLLVLWSVQTRFQACIGLGDVDLPFGEINVVVLTDVHSWIGGHTNEASHNADYGDILSFYQRLRDHCNTHKMDLWLVENGDWIDGTGLSLSGDISYLTPLLERMTGVVDAVNVGNHELYRTDVVHQFMRPGGFVESWGDRYLSSNVLYTPKNEPLGYRFRFLRGKNATVLTFGFLYNMDDASEAVTVESVESVVDEQWFSDVLTNANTDPQGNFDAIMVLAHMDVKDQLVFVLLNRIRSLVGDTMPVQFITGHTHYRGVHTIDRASVSFEAGRFLDTIGFVSFPTQKTLLAGLSRGLQGEQAEEEEGETESTPVLGPGGIEWANVSDVTLGNTTSTTVPSSLGTTDSPSTVPPTTNTTTVEPTTISPTLAPTEVKAALFHQKFIDTNVEILTKILGVQELATEEGARLSDFIFRTRSDLGLLDLVGCSSKSYYLNRTVEENDSIWKLFLDQVAPYQLLNGAVEPKHRRMFLGQSGGFRYDLIGPQLIKDDVIAVSPFNETIFSLGPSIPGTVVKRLVAEVLNGKPNPFDDKLDNYMLYPYLDDLNPDTFYQIMAPEFGVKEILDGLNFIQYNETVNQTESGYSITDVWLNFVKNMWECKKSNSPSHQDDSNSDHNHVDQHHGTSGSTTGSHGKDKGVHAGAPYYVPNEAEDRKRTTMAFIAVGCTLLLGGLYIFQLHRVWLGKYQERQRLIFSIDDENDNELI